MENIHLLHMMMIYKQYPHNIESNEAQEIVIHYIVPHDVALHDVCFFLKIIPENIFYYTLLHLDFFFLSFLFAPHETDPVHSPMYFPESTSS